MQTVYRIAEIEAFVIGRLLSQLDDRLTYHGIVHTLDVTESALRIAQAEGINDPNQLNLLRLAGLFHDTGFLNVYQGHEVESCRLAQMHLPGFGLADEDVSRVCDMIMATRIPQNPQTHLQQILCDADLDYLGRQDFYTIGNTLFEEWSAYGIVTDEDEWNCRQIRFISGHEYFTEFSRTHREPEKQIRLQELRKKMNGQCE